MTDAGMERLTFTAQDGRIGRFGELCLQYLPQERPCRVLDLGCGTGAQIFYLLDRLPLAQFVGLDISKDNIAAARSEAERRGDDRVQFVLANYLDWDTEPFDAILSDSVLQLIAGSDERLYRKLENNLRPQGRLLISLPDDRLYNRVLWGFRRAIRPFRGLLFEPVLLGLAKIIHPDWPTDLLRQRIPYLYMLPVRYDGAAMRTALTEECGLMLLADVSLPWESPAKARHRLIVYEKSGDASADCNAGNRASLN